MPKQKPSSDMLDDTARGSLADDMLDDVKPPKTRGKYFDDALDDVLDDVVKGKGKTTLSDWTGKTGELAETSPVKIPENATVKASTKVAGYDQISYKWTEGGYTFEARWHTKTPGAPAGQGNTWVVSRVTPGTPTGQMRLEHILAGDKWVSRFEWQSAINAYQNGTITAAQEALLKAGHWLAP